MRSVEMEALDVLVGEWRLTLSDAWFLEPAGVEVQGAVHAEWIGEAFVLLRFDLEGEQALVLGRSDANEAYTALYHDERGVSRVFAMEFGAGRWTLTREDPDFHQRWIAELGPDRIEGRWEASEDAGTTWRKDFDLTLTRVPTAPCA